MPKKNKVLSSYQNQRIVTPLDHFIFEDDKFYLIVKGFESLKVFIKPAKASWGVEPRMADILSAWLKDTNLPSDDCREWSKVVFPIISYYDIPIENRILAYQLYRETTIAKLERIVKNLTEVMQLLQQQPVLTMHEQKFIQKRIDFYNGLYSKTFKDKRSGPQKFFIPLLSSLIRKMNDLNVAPTKQVEHLVKLYDIGEFDSFRAYYTDKYEFFDEDGAKNSIKQIYRKAAKLS